MASIKTTSNTGKQDVPNVLWIGVRDGDPGPIMLAREKPEAFKLKVKSYLPEISFEFHGLFKNQSCHHHSYLIVLIESIFFSFVLGCFHTILW